MFPVPYQVGIAALFTSVLANPTLTPRQDTSGCGKTHNMGYNNNLANHQVTSKGVLRNYTIYVPTTYNDDLTKQWPLIIDYHGNGGTGDQQHDNSLYDDYTDAYVIIYPNGYEGHWQGPSYAVPGIDDLQFTTDLVAHAETQYCLDASRFYASGKSNGGGFVDTLACSDAGDQFAAFAMASAALYTDLALDDCSKQRAILESHGLQDETIPYHPTGPGSGGPLPDVGEWVEWWAERDGCDPDDGVVVEEDGYNVTTYSCGGFEDVVTHYKVFDLGHCWPSSTGDNFDSQKAECADRVLDYTPFVLDFFGRWTQSNAPGN